MSHKLSVRQTRTVKKILEIRARRVEIREHLKKKRRAKAARKPNVRKRLDWRDATYGESDE